MSDNLDPRDADDLFAAEYAIGLLDGLDQTAAERRLESDEEFAASVDIWHRRLEPLLGSAPERAPPPHLWNRIDSMLPGEKLEAKPLIAANDTFSGGNVVQLRKKVTAWRGYSAAITAVAAALALVVGLDMTKQAPVQAPVATGPSSATPQPLLVASVAPENGPLSITAAYDQASSSLVIQPASLNTPEGRDRELWVVPASGNPLSLGVIRAGEAERRIVPANVAALLQDKATIAISDEPTGGSPTGLPTGAILATGQFSTI